MNCDTRPGRAHDCDRDTNKFCLSIEWAEDGRQVLVSTWECRRCGRTWTTEWSPQVAEEERLAALRARVAQVAAEMREECAP